MITDETLLSLAGKYGTPIYVIDESELDKKQKEFSDAFSILPIPVRIAYPFKVNSINEVLEYMYKCGRWAEVASDLELNLALAGGFNPTNIILNAPHKPIALLKHAIDVGCKIHIDNESELIMLVNLIDEIKLTQNIDIGLRISTLGDSLWSRFGFKDEEYTNAINIIKRNNKLRLVGLHTHRSSINNLEEYKHHIEQIFSLTSVIADKYGINLDYIDIGSGFAIDWPKPLGNLNWSAPTLDEYVQIVYEAYHKWKPRIRQLIIEPGRKSVASAACFITKIVSIKKRGTIRYLISDGALNFIPGAEIYKYRISRVATGQFKQSSEEIGFDNVLCGCLCDSLDVLDTSIHIQNLEVDQLLRIDDVGGYDIARSFVWQLPYPTVIWISNEVARIVQPKNLIR